MQEATKMVSKDMSIAHPGPGLPVLDLWVRMQGGEAHAWGEWFQRHDGWVTRVLRWELWGLNPMEAKGVAEGFRLALMREPFSNALATAFPRRLHELLYGLCRDACSLPDVPNYQVFSHAFPIGDTTTNEGSGLSGLWNRWEKASSVTVWTTYVLVLVLAGLLLAAVLMVFGKGPTVDSDETSLPRNAKAWDLVLEGLDPSLRTREMLSWAELLHDGGTWLYLNPSLDTNVTVRVDFRSPEATDTRWRVRLVVAQRSDGASLESDLLYETLSEWEAERADRFTGMLKRLPSAAHAK